MSQTARPSSGRTFVKADGPRINGVGPATRFQFASGHWISAEEAAADYQQELNEFRAALEAEDERCVDGDPLLDVASEHPAGNFPPRSPSTPFTPTRLAASTSEKDVRGARGRSRRANTALEPYLDLGHHRLVAFKDYLLSLEGGLLAQVTADEHVKNVAKYLLFEDTTGLIAFEQQVTNVKKLERWCTHLRTHYLLLWGTVVKRMRSVMRAIRFCQSLHLSDRERASMDSALVRIGVLSKTGEKKATQDKRERLTRENEEAAGRFCSLADLRQILRDYEPTWDNKIASLKAGQKWRPAALTVMTGILTLDLIVNVKASRPQAYRDMTVDNFHAMMNADGVMNVTEFKTSSRYGTDVFIFDARMRQRLAQYVGLVRPAFGPKAHCRTVLVSSEGASLTQLAPVVRRIVAARAPHLRITPKVIRDIVTTEACETYGLDSWEMGVLALDLKHSSFVQRAHYLKMRSDKTARSSLRAIRALGRGDCGRRTSGETTVEDVTHGNGEEEGEGEDEDIDHLLYEDEGGRGSSSSGGRGSSSSACRDVDSDIGAASGEPDGESCDGRDLGIEDNRKPRTCDEDAERDSTSDASPCHCRPGGGSVNGHRCSNSDEGVEVCNTDDSARSQEAGDSAGDRGASSDADEVPSGDGDEEGSGHASVLAAGARQSKSASRKGKRAPNVVANVVMPATRKRKRKRAVTARKRAMPATGKRKRAASVDMYPAKFPRHLARGRAWKLGRW